MPAAGSRGGDINADVLKWQGQNAMWWSHTAAEYGHWYASMELYNYKFTFDNYSSASNTGATIRCVTETNP